MALLSSVLTVRRSWEWICGMLPNFHCWSTTEGTRAREWESPVLGERLDGWIQCAHGIS